MLTQALYWLTGQTEADATPRAGPSARAPAVEDGGVRSLAGTDGVFAPGSLVSIRGRDLTSGSSLTARGTPFPLRLAGTHIEVDGRPAPLLSVSPGEVIAQLPFGLETARAAALTVSSVNRAGDAVAVRIEEAAPGLLAGVRVLNSLLLYATGLGGTSPEVAAGSPPPANQPARTVVTPEIRVDGRTAEVAFSGLVPGLAGVYLVVAVMPPDTGGGPHEVVLQAGGQVSNTLTVQP
jgi:hypothetical protein